MNVNKDGENILLVQGIHFSFVKNTRFIEVEVIIEV